MDTQESLSLHHRFEPAHNSFSYPSFLVRNLGAVVGVLLLSFLCVEDVSMHKIILMILLAVVSSSAMAEWAFQEDRTLTCQIGCR
jgi:hypothetical protein